MLSNTKFFFENLWSNLRIADAIDIFVFALIVYVGLAWFKKSRSRFVMLGVFAMLLTYAGARLLDLTLTLILFQSGITVALVALVVIFQEEIRRTFEWLGNPKALRHKTSHSDSTQWIDDIVNSTREMARSRTGALIVFKGKEPLDRHIQGGTKLEGRISSPLLLSLFDSSSPGHDGAVVVENGWVRSFGAHLPLSTNIAGDEPFGTRHCAAVGLSERSDALILVVSEERGEVSFAKDGGLQKVGTTTEVRGSITAYLHAVSPEKLPPRISVITRNFFPKVLSIVIALITWIVVVGPQGESVGRSYRVPITLRNTPSSYMLDQPRPSDVLVTLSGRQRAFRKLDPAGLVVTVDTGNIRSGAQRVRLGQGDLELPRGILLHRIDPNTITLVAHETLQKAYPVHVQTRGKLPAHWKLKQVYARPKSVELIVRKKDVGTFSRIETDPIELSDITQSTSIMRNLVVPPGTRLANELPSETSVFVEIEPK